MAIETASVRRNDWVGEWPLPATVLLLAALLLGKDAVAELLHQPAALLALIALICAVILAAAIAVVRHAEVLAHRLGEPAGTLLLTLAITGLEVAMVGFVMSTGEEKPTLARDTMYAVVMLVLNGFIGLALVMGALRHGEQRYNLLGANAFLIMIVPLAVLGLVLPDYTKTTPGPILSIFQMEFLSLMSVGIYGIFLFVQNQRHRDYFRLDEAGDEADSHEIHESRHPTAFHAAMLGAYGVPLVMLAKQMSTPLDAMVVQLGAPVALSGLLLALLVLTPEAIAALRAALENRLQRSINILLGSVLASIGLTIPSVAVLSMLIDLPLELGLRPTETVLLALTLVVSAITLAGGRSTVLHGAVHLVIFGAFLFLSFVP